MYLQAEVFHKPLVSQEVAGHVGVSVVDEHPQFQREELQIHILHCWVQSGVIPSNSITSKRTKGFIMIWLMSHVQNYFKVFKTAVIKRGKFS